VGEDFFQVRIAISSGKERRFVVEIEERIAPTLDVTKRAKKSR
jgi:hypothetical protein